MIIQRILMRLALFILKYNFHILIHYMEKGNVIYCYCCDEHLKESLLEVSQSPNPMQLTLDENGRNRELGFFGMRSN